MKIKYITLFLFILSLKASAQEFRAFLPSGFNSSQLDRDGMSGYNKVGIMSGMGVMNNFKSKTTFYQLEILYSRKGSRFNPDRDFYFDRYRLNYIEMPIQGYYYVHKKIALGGGLYWGYLINARRDNGGGYFEFSDSPLVKKMDIGYTAGIVYKLSEKTEINARFSYSLDRLRNYQFINNVITYSLRIYLGGQKIEEKK